MTNESIWEIKNIDSRCITVENPTGEKGKGAMSEPWPGHVGEHLGKGWEFSLCVGIKVGETFTVADIAGPAMIRHIWMTCGFDKDPYGTIPERDIAI